MRTLFEMAIRGGCLIEAENAVNYRFEPMARDRRIHALELTA
jgi:hypothetical protein